MIIRSSVPRGKGDGGPEAEVGSSGQSKTGAGSLATTLCVDINKGLTQDSCWEFGLGGCQTHNPIEHRNKTDIEQAPISRM